MLVPTGMTLAALTQFVDDVIQKLQNAGTTLEDNGSIVIGNASTQVSALLTQLKAMVGEEFTKPLNELKREVRSAANQVFATVSKLDALLKNQEACLLINAQVFLAGVHSITSGIKSGLPFIADDAPRIDYFQFVGHTPSVVPKEGGQVVIYGFDLWEDTKFPPEVKIFEEDRKTVVSNITPQKAQDNNSFSFGITADFIQKNQGKNLQLQVIPKEKRWVDIFGPKVLGIFFMPLVIPKIQFAKFSIVAHLQYETEVDQVKTLDFKRFGMGNDSCEDRKNYAHTEAWPLPDGAQIIGVESRDPDMRNQANVQFSFAGNTVTASGWLDTASCIRTPFGNRLIHDTHWWLSAAPKISYKQKGTQIVDSKSGSQELQFNKANFLLTFPKSNDSMADDTFWFEITMENDTIQKNIFTSPKITADSFSTQVQGLMIDAHYNGTAVNGNAELALEISLPNCGF